MKNKIENLLNEIEKTAPYSMIYEQYVSNVYLDVCLAAKTLPQEEAECLLSLFNARHEEDDCETYCPYCDKTGEPFSGCSDCVGGN